MTIELKAEYIRGGSCGNLAAGTIDGSKIACAGLQADRLSAAMLGGDDIRITAAMLGGDDIRITAAMLGGDDIRITAGVIDARHIKS